MKPGKKLDEKIAVEIMNLIPHGSYKHLWRYPDHHATPFINLPEFSMNIRDAFEIKKMMEAQGFTVEVLNSEKPVARVYKGESNTADAILIEGENEAHAISLAAIRLKELGLLK